jgi:lactoylglutathione lyase
MQIETYGIILNVEHFDECVNFYKTVFNLRERFSKEEGDFRLTCLEFGRSYLMIELGGVAQSQGKGVEQNPTKLRFNVESVVEARKHLSRCGISAEIMGNDWGTIININDPDGNPISIRDESGFLDQHNV